MNTNSDSTLVKIVKAWWNINMAVVRVTIKGIIWILTLQWLFG